MATHSSILAWRIPRTEKLGRLWSRESQRVGRTHIAFFMVQLSHPYMTTGKTIALTRWTFVVKVMSLLFNMLARFIIDFLPRNKQVLISWLKSPSIAILEPKKIVCHCFPIYLP